MWQCAQTCVIDCAIIYFLSRLSTNASLFHLVQLTSASATEGRRTEDIPRLLSPPEKADRCPPGPPATFADARLTYANVNDCNIGWKRLAFM